MPLVILLICLTTLVASGQGRIEGKVELPATVRKGTTPPRYQGKVQPGPPAPRVGVIYLEGDFAKTLPTNSVVTMPQKNLQFAEAILPIQKGTTVEFPNVDDEYHNVLSFSRTKNFDLGRYLKGEKPPPSVVFDKPGLVDLNCEIHDHMFANILVLDTPYFTKTDTNGNFTLDNLPAGKFTLKAWLTPKLVHSTEVEIKNGEATKLDFPAK